MNNLNFKIKVLLPKPLFKQLPSAKKEKLFEHKLGSLKESKAQLTPNRGLYKKPVLISTAFVQTSVFARNRFANMATFHQTSLLQSKKKVSGEISKEPFLDILLTDLEQSSFSLIFKNFGLENEGLLRKQVTLPRLKTSICLFSKTELTTRKKSFVTTKIQNDLKIFYVFNQKSKPCLVKPFFVRPRSDLRIKQSRKTDNFFVYTLPKRSSYLRYARVYIPSHSGGKNSHQLGTVKDPTFVRDALERQLAGKLCLGLFSKHNPLQKSRQISCSLQIGDHVHCGDKIGSLSGTPIVIGESGKVLRVSQTQITIQKMQPVLFYSQAEIHVESNEWVKRGTPILTLTHQTLVTGDIVQGIPRIEQLFEASTAAPPGAALQDFGSPSDDDSLKKSSIDDYFRSHHTSQLLSPTSYFIGTRDEGVPEHSSKTIPPTGENTDQISYSSGEKRYDSKVQSAAEEKPMFLYKTLQSQLRETFRKKWDQYPLPVAVRQSLEEIQQIIVESIQKVYISQGVLIADKHIEIIVRQMTCKAQVFDGGTTGLLLDEIVSLQHIESANISTPGQKALYLPVVMGLTRSALSSDSFVSAASFQETTRVLSRDAVAGKTDFLRGLKEKVIIGDLIDAGTGLDTFYIYSLFSKKIFENKFREILNRRVTHKTLKKLVLTVAKPEQRYAQ